MKAIFTPYIYILLFCYNISGIYSQNLILHAKSKNSKNQSVIDNISFEKNHQNKKSAIQEINKITQTLNYQGYLNISSDLTIIKDTIYSTLFNLGDQTELIRIYFPPKYRFNEIISKNILQQISTNYSTNYFEIPFPSISKALQIIADDYEEKGNSFVQVSLKNIHLDKSNQTAVAEIKITNTRTRTIDKIIIKGYDNFPKSFISHDLNLKLKSVFNKDKLTSASIAIKSIPFVEEQKAPEVLFTNDSTFIYLFLKKKNSNKFDGVIGFTSKEEESGLEFNGYLDFLFSNVFNSGESIVLFWKNNGNDSQRFNISAETPYLFGLPIIPRVQFKLFKQDTSFTTVSTDLSISYVLNNQSRINAGLNTENSTNLLKNNPTDNFTESYKNNFYGLGYNLRILRDNILFTNKFYFDISAFTGNRKSNSIKTSQTKVNLLTNYLWSFNNRNHVFIQNQSSLLISDNYLNNELFRIGGVNSIRGFNEESIFTSSFSIFNLEYRFNPSDTNYFFTITDFGLARNDILNESLQLFGFGLGYAFTTKAGLLNLSYAIGKTNHSPFNFNDSKLHIKLISFF